MAVAEHAGPKARPEASLDPPLPREVQFEVTGACNLRCRMCLVRYAPPLNKIEGSLPFELFKRVVDALPELRKVTLQGLGEPLLAPDLFRRSSTWHLAVSVSASTPTAPC